MLSSKKILVVTPFFYPAWQYGGPPRVIFDLCSQLTKEGFQITVATTDVLDSKRNLNKENSVNNIKIKYFKNISNNLAYYFKVFSPRGLWSYLDENITYFDIIHIVDFRNYCTYLTYKSCLKYKVPYVISPYGTMPYTNGFRGVIKKMIDIHWGLNCLINAKKVIVQTDNERQEAIKLGVFPENISLIPLPINADKFKKSDIDSDIRKKYNISPSSKVILFVGRINEHKTTPLMIQALAKLIKDNIDYNFKLIIVGRDDGYKKRLEKLIEDYNLNKNFIFLGPIFYPEILAIYKSADVFFMAPSHFEETSTASLEALACGTPVVITEQADIPYFHKYLAGYIVKRNINEINSALEKILIKKDYKKSDCVKIIDDNFSIKKVADEYKKAYYDL